MRLTGMMKFATITAVLSTALAVAAPASADSHRGYFGDRGGSGQRIVVRDHDRDFRGRHEMRRRDEFVHQARFHHYGWSWHHRDGQFRD